MNLKEAFDQPYRIKTSTSGLAETIHNNLVRMGCQDISIYKVLDISDSNIYIISYIYEDAVEAHILNDKLLAGGLNKKSETFKRSEFSRMIATTMRLAAKKARNHDLPIRFYSDDDRKIVIYKKAILRFNDVEIKELKNYENINGIVGNAYLVTKKDTT